MKSKTFVFLSILLIVFLYSCEKIGTGGSTDIAAKLSGNWAVSENYSLLKSTLDTYNTYITIDEVDSNTVFISNFYQIGPTYDIEATISGSNITIPMQTVDGFIFSGSGIISKNYKTITWKYKVVYETNEVDNVDAIYEKIE